MEYRHKTIVAFMTTQQKCRLNERTASCIPKYILEWITHCFKIKVDNQHYINIALCKNTFNMQWAKELLDTLSIKLNPGI